VDASSLFMYPDVAEHGPVGFLAGLRSDEVETILSHMQTVRYARGEVAVRRGDRDDSLFVATRGLFEVIVPTTQGIQRARWIRPGELFGELAFFDHQPRSADVRAVENSDAVSMSPGGFDRLRLAKPQLALRFALDLGRVLSERFRDYDRRLAALGQH
jgi:CRP/FNR family transcriptional regulator, cyclic AMP receptor protein